MVVAVGGVLLLAVPLVALRWGRVAALITALGATMGINFYFVEPKQSLFVDDRLELLALLAYLAVAVALAMLVAAGKELDA